MPLPAAIAPGSPWSDLTKTGDTFYSHNLVDNFQVSYDGYLKDSAYLYANGRDLKDPMLSPIYGDLHGFPPTILTSGTRDLFLSLTVRIHRKLRHAGVEAALAGVRGPLARPIHDQSECAGDARGVRGDRALLRCSHGALNAVQGRPFAAWAGQCRAIAASIAERWQ